ncbi:2-dehydropantoate 2-reductase [Verrucomicrobia bacterium]|nr:2-dehydropantoate 2-reductase [Verrucomicrobiota bacterium]MDB4458957.1 2-dehydropantoate 2-reductase [bacterium]
MKIAIVGCGALGGFYGAKLLGHSDDIHFLFRSDFETVKQRGLKIRSLDGDFHCRPRCYQRPEEIGPVDLVIIGLKSIANEHFKDLLTPLVSERTTVLSLQNGLGNTDQLATLFTPGQIMGGLCFVCLNRIEPGLIDHIAHGRITLGEYQRPPEPRTHDIAQLFERSGIPCQVLETLEAGQWEKLVWNIPFNGLGVAASLGLAAFQESKDIDTLPKGAPMNTKELLNSASWSELVKALMLEIITVANLYQSGINNTLADTMIQRTREMGEYKASTVLDFEKGVPMELDSIFFEPLRRAEAKNAPTPILKRLCHVLGRFA